MLLGAVEQKYIHSLSHMTKMAAMPIYVKNLQNQLRDGLETRCVAHSTNHFSATKIIQMGDLLVALDLLMGKVKWKILKCMISGKSFKILA